jgi:hypothetical protein
VAYQQVTTPTPTMQIMLVKVVRLVPMIMAGPEMQVVLL